MALSGLILCGTSEVPVIAAGTDEGGYQVIANAYGFGCGIPDCDDASKNIREISIDELNIDVVEPPSPNGYRTYSPGAAHWGQAKFTSARVANGDNGLQKWFEETRAGKGIRKNITVTLYKSDKSPGRSYVLLECEPTHWEASEDTQNREPIETVWVRPRGGIALFDGSNDSIPPPKAEATSSDKFAQVRGFKVDIANATGKEVDTAWESVSGGEMIIELTETTIGADKFQTNSPGHKSVGEITLRGAMTDKRAAMCAWIQDAASGKEWRRNVTITENTNSPSAGGGTAKTYNYHDCFPTRYVFPKLSVYAQRGPVEEELTLRAVRDPGLPPGTVGVLTIEGCPIASRGAVAVALDDRALDRDLLPQTNSMRSPSVTILLQPGTGSEIRDWVKAAFDKKSERKSASIVFKDRVGAERLRKIVLHDCMIESHVEAVTNTTGNVMEEVALKPIRVELK
jgi:hypothetical protein